MYSGYQGACHLQCPPKKAYYLDTIYWVVHRIQPTENLPCHIIELSYSTACYLFHSHCPHTHKQHFLLLEKKKKQPLFTVRLVILSVLQSIPLYSNSNRGICVRCSCCKVAINLLKTGNTVHSPQQPPLNCTINLIMACCVWIVQGQTAWARVTIRSISLS